MPVLVHAGRGIPALGRDTLRLSGAYPGARLILAHAAISDLAWLWRELPEHPNVFIDTSWWLASDLLALFSLCPPGSILFASDSPYGTPLQGAVIALRCALQAGLGPDAVRAVAGAQMARLLDGAEPLDLGPAPGPQAGAAAAGADPLLARVSDYLVAALNRRVAEADGDEPVALARLSAAVGDDAPQADAVRVDPRADRRVRGAARRAPRADGALRRPARARHRDRGRAHPGRTGALDAGRRRRLQRRRQRPDGRVFLARPEVLELHQHGDVPAADGQERVLRRLSPPVDAYISASVRAMKPVSWALRKSVVRLR